MSTNREHLILSIIGENVYVDFHPWVALKEAMRLQGKMVCRTNRYRTREVNLLAILQFESDKVARIQRKVEAVLMSFHVNVTGPQWHQEEAPAKARALVNGLKSHCCRLSYLRLRLGDGINIDHQRVKEMMLQRAARFHRMMRELKELDGSHRYKFRLVAVSPPGFLTAAPTASDNEPDLS